MWLVLAHVEAQGRPRLSCRGLLGCVLLGLLVGLLPGCVGSLVVFTPL
jgi:hypothetical protein